MNGHDATKLLAEQRPDLIPLLQVMVAAQRLIDARGPEWFTEGMDELLRRGIIEVAWLSP